MTKTDEKDSNENITETEVITPDIVKSAVIVEEDPIVEEVFEYLKEVFVRHIRSFMLETGQYLIEKFYNGDYQLAQEKKFTKNESLNKLFLKIQNDSSGNVPKKTWLYNSIDLAIDENKYKELSAYGNLGHSHKVKLTNTGKLPDQTKISLIEEAAEKEYSVAKLVNRISEEKRKSDENYLPLDEELKPDILKSYDVKQLTEIKNKTENRLAKVKTKISLYEVNLDLIGNAIKTEQKKVIKTKPKKRKTKKRLPPFDMLPKDRNFADISIGCQNDCIYCSCRLGIHIEMREKEGIDWKDEEIIESLLNPRRFKSYKDDDTVAFPHGHDITPNNVGSCVKFLKRLLIRKNVMILSKPNFECIKRVCTELDSYKDNIIFRFSIGAMNDDILRFWDNNSPLYNERKESLKYAHENGFRTSVSIDPMLDSENVVALATELLPYLTHSIWIGKMQHRYHIKKSAEKNKDDELLNQLKVIEAGQTDERIKEIYADFQKTPEFIKKIKWTNDLKRVLGIKVF